MTPRPSEPDSRDAQEAERAPAMGLA
jgi:hypothetical protein